VCQHHGQVKPIQFMSFTKFTKLFSLLTKARHSLPTVHDHGRGYSNRLKTSAEGYTLPTRFDTSAGRNPRFDIHQVCEVQIIKQNLSLAHPSRGSFPRARDTEPRSGASSSAHPGCRVSGIHLVQK
jgi:hypothetical protein